MGLLQMGSDREIKSKLKKMNIDDKPKIEQPKDIVKQTENKTEDSKMSSVFSFG